MKRVVIWACALLLFPGIWTGCGDDRFEASIYGGGETEERNEVRQWLYDNYVVRYNIEVIYAWKSMEVPMQFNIIPPKQDTVISFMKMAHTAWIVPYLEICGEEQMKPLFQKQIQLIGSKGYNSTTQQATLGTAAGRKLLLFDVDSYNAGSRESVKNFVRIMHHEFGHMLNYYRAYPLSFKQITPTLYTPDWGNYVEEARELGFVTPYAMAEPDEDFVETLAQYITDTPEEWAAVLAEAGDASAIILRKTDMVRTYMEENWRVDIDVMRSHVTERINDCVAGNYK
ncbi:MAG: putative zinc-binding metallopeptidase [Culturomica sp.]|jgi:substrate import-associated zinc metallohydrolase lipoprotein|nr:putative zinc-binding metallopeptidase [Culturomica sp.]